MNLRGLYPIAEVPVPRDGDKRGGEEAYDKGKGGEARRTIMKMTKTYRDFVDLIRFARGPARSARKPLIFIILTHANRSRG